jgi:F0F1-type ATP synthase epsilon subunit
MAKPAKAKPPESTTMRVKIYAPFKVYYDGQANSLTASNKVGPFDILPQHHNFISLLESGNVTVRGDGKADFNMPITRGIMHVKADFVRVFLDI